MAPCGRVSCVICVGDQQSEWCTLRCGHVFHDVCVNAWLKQKKCCPVCRADRPGQPKRLFLDDAPEEDSPAPQDTDYTAELRELRQKLRQKDQQVSQQQKELETSRQELQEHQLSLQQVTEHVGNLEKTCQALKAKHTKSQARADDLEAALYGLKAQHDRLLDGTRAELCKLEQENVTLKRMALGRQAAVAQAQASAGTAQAVDVQALQQKLQQEQRARQAAEAALVAVEASAQEKLAQIQADAQEHASREYHATKRDLIERESELFQLQERMQEREAELQELRGVLQALQGDTTHTAFARQAPLLSRQLPAAAAAAHAPNSQQQQCGRLMQQGVGTVDCVPGVQPRAGGPSSGGCPAGGGPRQVLPSSSSRVPLLGKRPAETSTADLRQQQQWPGDNQEQAGGGKPKSSSHLPQQSLQQPAGPKPLGLQQQQQPGRKHPNATSSKPGVPPHGQALLRCLEKQLNSYAGAPAPAAQAGRTGPKAPGQSSYGFGRLASSSPSFAQNRMPLAPLHQNANRMLAPGANNAARKVQQRPSSNAVQKGIGAFFTNTSS